MKKVTIALVLLASLSFAANQIQNANESFPKNNSPLNTNEKIVTDSLKNDTLAKNEVEIIETTETAETVIEKKIENFKKTVASWYGGKFHGRKTASGKVYNMNELTAAHKTLPFGTLVKFKNPKNDKVVVVRITDRGPYIKGREFDLSKAAFQELASLNSGVLHLDYEIIKK